MKRYILVLVVIGLLTLVSAATIEIGNSGRPTSRIVNMDEIISEIKTFLNLGDTPSSYAGAGSDCVRVNAGETGLVFDTCAVGGVTIDTNATTECGDGEYLDGSGSCINFNITVSLLDTNASTACSGDEVLLGDGTCTSSSGFGGANDGLFVNYTLVTTTGNITNGSLNGYPAANNICNSEIPGSHMCTAGEIMNSINQNVSNNNFTATFRISEFAPGFLAEANDCAGWTSATGTALGSIMVGDPTFTNTYGTGSLVACNAVRAIGCCL